MNVRSCSTPCIGDQRRKHSEFLGALTLTAALLGGLAGSGRGFEVGEIYLLTNNAPDDGPAILHISPLSGDVDVLLDLDREVAGTFTYDPLRDRLLYMDQLTSEMKAVDDAGVMTDFIPGLVAPGLIAARGNGIVYRWNDDLDGFQYIDANDNVHDLLDESGTERFGFPGGAHLNELVYDRLSNALICFESTYDGITIAVCTDPAAACAVRIPLNDEGIQVAGPLEAAQASISLSYVRVVGAGQAPEGVVWVVDSNTADEEPRMQLLDTVAMTSAPFARNSGYAGVPTTNAGMYSNARAQAVILDSSGNVLRAYSFGESGPGTAFSDDVSGPLWNERARLIEVCEALDVAVDEGPLGGRGRLRLEVSPNPFSASTMIRFSASERCRLRIAILDPAGRTVRLLDERTWEAGGHAIRWDGRDSRNRRVPSGVYCVSIGGPDGGGHLIGKAVILR